jgi:hypothetical protein
MQLKSSRMSRTSQHPKETSFQRRERRLFEAEARRQSFAVTDHAHDPNSDEAEIMRWIECVACPL